MKKQIFIIGLIIFTGSFLSCQKNKEAEPKIDYFIQSLEDKNVQERICSFVKKMNDINNTENSTLFKSEEIIPLNDAEWSLEASMNYLYCVVFDGAKYAKTDSATFMLPINSDGTCSEKDIAALFLILQASVEASMAAHNEHLLAISLTTLQDESETATFYSEYIYASEYPDNHDCYFQPYDYWYPALGWGLCSGPYQGQCIGRDGGTELTDKINMRVPCYYSSPNAYFTDIESLNFTSQDQIILTECISPEQYNAILIEFETGMLNGINQLEKFLIGCDDVQLEKDEPLQPETFRSYVLRAQYGKLRIRDASSGIGGQLSDPNA